jgi:hypothetical protein
MKQRNMDIGLDDGYVTPVLVPDICEGATPQSYPAPKLDLLYNLGFEMLLEVKPAEFEKNSILSIIYPDGGGNKIRFPDDLPKIMDHTRAEAIKRGYTVTPPFPPQKPAAENQPNSRIEENSSGARKQ